MEHDMCYDMCYVIVISQAQVGYHCYYTRLRVKPEARGRVLITMISYECL